MPRFVDRRIVLALLAVVVAPALLCLIAPGSAFAQNDDLITTTPTDTQRALVEQPPPTTRLSPLTPVPVHVESDTPGLSLYVVTETQIFTDQTLYSSMGWGWGGYGLGYGFGPYGGAGGFGYPYGGGFGYSPWAGWGSSGLASRTGVSRKYELVCSAPCSTHVRAGSYRFAVSTDDGSPVLVPQTINVNEATSLVAHFESRRHLRRIGWIILGVGLAVGGALTTGAVDHRASAPDGVRFPAMLGVGVGTMLTSVIIGGIFGSKPDRAWINSQAK